jgi:hypothetical protein
MLSGAVTLSLYYLFFLKSRRYQITLPIARVNLLKELTMQWLSRLHINIRHSLLSSGLAVALYWIMVLVTKLKLSSSLYTVGIPLWSIYHMLLISFVLQLLTSATEVIFRALLLHPMEFFTMQTSGGADDVVASHVSEHPNRGLASWILAAYSLPPTAMHTLKAPNAASARFDHRDLGLPHAPRSSKAWLDVLTRQLECASRMLHAIPPSVNDGCPEVFAHISSKCHESLIPPAARAAKSSTSSFALMDSCMLLETAFAARAWTRVGKDMYVSSMVISSNTSTAAYVYSEAVWRAFAVSSCGFIDLVAMQVCMSIRTDIALLCP